MALSIDGLSGQALCLGKNEASHLIELHDSLATKRTTMGINQLLSDLDQAQKRVRQLEDALKTSHGKQAFVPDPLVVENGSRNSVASGSTTPGSPSTGPEYDPLEMFGTLTIADGGDSRFLGISAASEVCIYKPFSKGKTHSWSLFVSRAF